ncbi:MAG: hypothetical protein ACRD16_00085, partial [Thermoanaerobaculia bacterium]
MSRKVSWRAILLVVGFFFLGAAGAVVWDLRGREAPADPTLGEIPGPVAAQAAPSPGPAQRLTAPTAATPATESPAEAARSAPRTRRSKQKFERVGIPMESR